MRRIVFFMIATGAFGATSAGGQSLATQVSRMDRGTVRVSYATRPGTCGSSDNVQLPTQVVHRGRWADGPCIEGPAFLQLEIREGRVVEADVRVGRESWPDAGGTVTNAGRLSAPQAARDLLTLAESAASDGGDDLVFAAILADSVELEAPLLRLARSSGPSVDTRKAAVFWLSHGTDAVVTDQLRDLAMDDAMPMDVREAAVFGLSQEDDHGGAQALRGIAQSEAPMDLREQAVFWLGQTRDPDIVPFLVTLAHERSGLGEKAVFALSQVGSAEALDALRSLVLDRSVGSDRRENAIFWLGQSGGSETVSFLAGAYLQLEDAGLKERVIFSVSQAGTEAAIDWLLDIAGSPDEPKELRKNALFWAGQAAGARGRLLALYDDLDDPDLKEQTIFVYSQMNHADALAKLLQIARTEPDHDLRENAIFWLGQSDDPAAMAYLEELIAD